MRIGVNFREHLTEAVSGSPEISRKSFPLENEAINKHVAWVKKQK
jgi:hypothetical protein